MADYTKDLSDVQSIIDNLSNIYELSLSDTHSIDEEISLGVGKIKEDSQSIKARINSAGVPVNWTTATPNKFGMVKFGTTKFGMNVHAGETQDYLDELLRKYNDKILWDLDDTISFSESIIKGITLNLSDSLSIDESVITSQFFDRELSSTLAIAENVANQTTLNISDIIPAKVDLLEISLEEGIVLSTGWKFLIRDSSGKYIASLVNARARWFKEALNHGGSAGFIIDATDDNCTEDILAINQNELIIKYKGYDMFGGQISAIKQIADGNNIYWEVVAKQFFNLLEKRYCGYNKSTGLSEPREFTTTDAGTIAWTLIDESQNEVNGDLGITQGTIQSSVNRTKSYERKNIAEAIIELADNDYGFDFEITPDKVFNVYYPFKGTTRDNVVFRYPGNCEEMEVLKDGWDMVNHELGLGRHWGGQEIYYVVDDATSQGTYGRREKIASYKDVEIQAFLNDMVTEDVAWNKDINKIIKFKSFIDDKSDLYMYELGDSVRVIADIFDINENLFVYERAVEIDDNDTAVVSLTLGD